MSLRRHHDLQREHRVLFGPLVGALRPLRPARPAAGRVREVRLALERRGDHRHHRPQRIGALRRRKGDHRERDDHADDRRRGRAEAGVAEAHVLEHHPHAREQRRGLLGSEPVDHRAGEHLGVVLRQAQPPRQRALQRRANLADVGQRAGAARAPFDVRADGDLLADGELAVVKVRQPAACGGATQRLHAVLASRSSRRSAWRARVSRDLTVPTATPSENAISS